MAPVRSTQPGPDVMHSDDWGDVPEQLGQRREMLQPGPYVFELPKLAVLKAAIKRDIEAEEGEEGQKVKVKRIAAVFRDGAELLVKQSPRGERNGELITYRISNVRRPRGKRGDQARPLVSDMDYLLQKLGEPKRPTSNEGYEQALLRHAGQAFAADVVWGAHCAKDRHIRVELVDDAGNFLRTTIADGNDPEYPEVQLGCGKRYYQRDLQKDEAGKYAERMSCECGAVLYCNENLENFRSAGGAGGTGSAGAPAADAASAASAAKS